MDVSGFGLLNPQTADTAAGKGLAENFDNFLKLLTTQLQHQDPLEPLKSTEFTQQLVQFSSVEQAINTNKTLEALLKIQQRNESLSAAALAGSEVEVFSDQIELAGEPVAFTYKPASKAESVKINILDANGTVIRSFAGETAAEKHAAEWDGLNGFGLPAPDGVYTVEVDAVDGAGEAIDVKTTYTGTVDSVTAKGGQVSLQIGGVSVPLDNILSVTAPAASGDNSAG